MNFDVEQLTEAATAKIIRSALSAVWPNVHFTATTADTSLKISWTDGPWPEDVRTVADAYIASPDATPWDNTVILSSPNGEFTAVYPGLDHLETCRTVSPSTADAVTAHLGNSGVQVSPDFSSESGDKVSFAALAALEEYSTPIPPGAIAEEVVTTSSEDERIMRLCDLLNQWCSNPAGFSEDDFGFIGEVLCDPDGKAVVVSALSDEAPVPGQITDLVEEVVNVAFRNGDYDTYEHGRYALTLVFPDLETTQPSLFEPTVAPHRRMLAEMGQLLRTTVAGCRF